MTSTPRRFGLLAIVLITGALSGCVFQMSKPESEPRNPSVLKSYRWSAELRVESSLFDQANAPDALEGAPFVLKANVTGERVAPDRERAQAVVSPASIEPRETVTIGTQRWNRIGDGPWRLGGEPFPAARAYLGGTFDLSTRAILEPRESALILQLREEFASMPYHDEVMPTGAARRYSLGPDQVALVVEDPDLNPLPVLRTLPTVRIDFWIDQEREVLVGVRIGADSATQVNVFALEMHLTAIEPAGLTIEPPR